MNNMLDPAENSDLEMLSVNWTDCQDTKEGSANALESSGGLCVRGMGAGGEGNQDPKGVGRWVFSLLLPLPPSYTPSFLSSCLFLSPAITPLPPQTSQGLGTRNTEKNTMEVFSPFSAHIFL